MTEAMLSHAEAAEWLELAALENQRRALIAGNLQAAPDDASTAEYAGTLQRLLALDARIMALAQAGHSALAKQLQAIGLGRSAVQAYAQQSR